MHMPSLNEPQNIDIAITALLEAIEGEKNHEE